MKRITYIKKENVLSVMMLVATLLAISFTQTFAYGFEGNKNIVIADSYTAFAKIATTITEKASVGGSTLLIVSEQTPELGNCDGVTGAVTNGNGMYVVSFESQAKAETAFAILKQQGCSVEYDTAVAATEISKTSMSKQGSGNGDYLSWGASYMHVDGYKTRLKKLQLNHVVVAVVDSGVELSHNFLSSRLVRGYDFCDNDASPADKDGHGTHVAGTIVDCTGGMNNISIMPVRVLDEKGDGTFSDIANGILYAADNGADVINLSLGGPHSTFVDTAVNQAIARGCVVVVAAGNDNEDIDKQKVCPAHIKETITVGGISQDKKVVQFSNFGKYVDCAAPGYQIVSSYINNSFMSLSGTSMAAPHVSAMLAMAISRYGKLSSDEAHELIQRACNPHGSYLKYGNGIVDMANLMGSIKDLDISVQSKVELSDKNSVPKVTISRNGAALFPEKDYTVKYDKSSNIGTKELTIKGEGVYSGEVRKTFEVVPDGSSISKLTAGKGSCTIKWKEQPERTDGYQIRYSKNSSMKSSSTKLIKSNGTTSCKVSKLKSKKKYYFQVRTYKTVDGKKYYSNWSAKKSTKIK